MMTCMMKIKIDARHNLTHQIFNIAALPSQRQCQKEFWEKKPIC